MKCKLVGVKVFYDTEDTWVETQKEIEELLLMMVNIKRSAKIYVIKDMEEIK